MMNFNDFKKQLSKVTAAATIKGTRYENIHIEDERIHYTMESGNEEYIDINTLYALYTNNSRIDKDIIAKELNSQLYFPALAILKAAGFYNEMGIRQKILKSSGEKLKKFITAFLHFIPVVFIIAAIFIFSTEPWTSGPNILIGIILLIINLSFFIYATVFKKDPIQENTYTAYFTLMIFNVGIFPLFNYVKDYQEQNKVKMLYTVGLRSWGSKAEYYDIKVFYYDKFGNPYTLSDSIVNNPANWIPNLWTNYNFENNLKLKHETKFNKIGNKLFIELTNCGAILNPSVFDGKITSFYVDAHICYLQTDPSYDSLIRIEQYQSSQICLRVPVKVGSLNANEIYYGYEFFFSDYSWSKLRIPGFNFDFIRPQLYYRIKNNSEDQNAKQIISGINKTIFDNELRDSTAHIVTNSEIHLSALLFDDNASFYIYKGNSTHSLPLFNFKISEYGAFNLKEK